MINLHLQGAVRNVGKSQGYQGLSVLYHDSEHGPMTTTAWEMSPPELMKMHAGGHLQIHILGSRQPPIGLVVSDPDEACDTQHELAMRTVVMAVRHDPAALSCLAYLYKVTSQKLLEHFG